MQELQPLRPKLYQQLRRRFGAVGVTNRGLAVRWRLQAGLDGLTRRRVAKEYGDHWGETYFVNCAFCGDTRRRLYIGHCWDLYDQESDSDNLWLAYCQNENCLQLWANKLYLRQIVWQGAAMDAGDDVVVRAAKPAVLRDAGVVELPGAVYRTDRLPPDDEACLYLRRRRFDPVWLGANLGIGKLVDTEDLRYEWLIGRLIIPVIFKGRLATWQARRLDSGVRMKYFNAPGSYSKSCLYNFDVARNYDHVVVVEGATKTWRYGPESVGTFGKEGIEGMQAALLADNWPTIVMMLDPNARQRSEAVIAQLAQRCRVCAVDLAEGQEPDEMPPHVLRRLTAQALQTTQMRS